MTRNTVSSTAAVEKEVSARPPVQPCSPPPRDAVDEGDESAGAGDRAGDIQAAGVAFGFDEGAGAGEDGQADGDVDEEHPAPVERVGQYAAQQQADRGADAAHGRVHAHGRVARLAGREGGGDQGQRVGRGECRADALEDTGADQQALVRGEFAQQGGEREDGDARLECAPSAEEVTGLAAEQHQPAEGQRVGVDDPCQVRVGDTQVGLDGGQGDVGDRGVNQGVHPGSSFANIFCITFVSLTPVIRMLRHFRYIRRTPESFFLRHRQIVPAGR